MNTSKVKNQFSSEKFLEILTAKVQDSKLREVLYTKATGKPLPKK